MTGRLWYPQLDVFDTIRRVAALLSSYEAPPGIERLYIADFFLANPPLLHRTQMPQQTRRSFNKLRIPRPEKTFLTYPAAPLLFHKMEPIQKEAIRALSGKGLISPDGLRRGLVELTASGRDLLAQTTRTQITQHEAALVAFLTHDFAASSDLGPEGLRRRTGLRRVA